LHEELEASAFCAAASADKNLKAVVMKVEMKTRMELENKPHGQPFLQK